MTDERAEAQAKLMAMLDAKKKSLAGGTAKSAASGTAEGAKEHGARNEIHTAPHHAPAKKPVVVKLAPPAASASAVIGKAILVDANHRASQTLANLLKTRRVEALIAATGTEALRMLETEKPLMILVDNDLPDIGGFNLCSKIRALPNGMHTCIIMTSEAYHPEMKEQALMVDANGYLGKPINYAELITILQEFRKMQKEAQAANPAP